MISTKNHRGANCSRLNRSCAIAATLLAAWLTMPGAGAAEQNLTYQDTQAGPVIGELGGVAVAIPKAYAYFVEYDGEPHSLDRYKAPAHSKLNSPRLTSFAFDLQYPGGQPWTEAGGEAQRAAGQPATALRVGIESNSRYGAGGDFYLAKRAEAITAPGAHRYQYEALPSSVYGLKGYAPIGTDMAKRNLGRGQVDVDDRNMYVHHDSAGRVDTYIECGNMANPEERCKQYFNLTDTMRMRIWVGFRKEQLPQWREIQETVKRVVVGFAVKSAAG